jgi:hypothetical protein
MQSRRLQKAVETVIRGLAKRPSSRFFIAAGGFSDKFAILSLAGVRPAIRYCAVGSNFYNATMSNNSEVLILANGSSGSVIAASEPTPQFLLNACCLWCDRTFTPRTTGGSSQKFCCTGHRQQFWIAARRWTMRAIEAGLLSVDCLRASHTSVHAV